MEENRERRTISKVKKGDLWNNGEHYHLASCRYASTGMPWEWPIGRSLDAVVLSTAMNERMFTQPCGHCVLPAVRTSDQPILTSEKEG